MNFWNIPYVTNGNYCIFCKNYSKLYTELLGCFAYMVESKRLGIGEAQRDWGDLNNFKSNKRSHFSGANIEKGFIIYTTAISHEARFKRILQDKSELVWSEEDINFDI